MVILDFPYVSEFLQESLIKAALPVIKTPSSGKLEVNRSLNWISEEEAISIFKANHDTPLYTNSENSINWISENLSFTGIPQKINLFKNKVKFRELLKPSYPDYYFGEILFNDIHALEKESLPYPIIIKPSVGFFSLGVYKLNSQEDWPGVYNAISGDIKNGNSLYPEEVYNTSSFILEECIPGKEFAIDVCYDGEGEATILNITEHYFTSDDDFSDRLYQFRPETFRKYYSEFLGVIQSIGTSAKLTNFPAHIELRIRPDGLIIPIEVNPLRFGGWCTTADLAGMSFGFNPYEICHSQQKPNWDRILSSKEGKAVNLLLLDNITGLKGNQIKGFDYQKLGSKFRNVIDLRKIDYTRYPIFGFLFAETDSDEEPILEEMLKSDFREFFK